MTAEPRVAVGAVVFDPRGRVLLVRRARPPAAGSWTLPGGKLRFGEPLAQGVCRELLEETSLHATAHRLVEVVEVLREGFHYVIHDYLCVLHSDPSAAVPGDDAAELAWVDPDRLADFDVTDAVARVVRSAAELGRAPEAGSR